MSIVLFEKVLVLLDSIQERVEQIDKAKSFVELDVIFEELGNVANAIKSVQGVQKLLGLSSTSAGAERLQTSIAGMVNEKVLEKNFDTFRQEFLEWAEVIRNYCKSKLQVPELSHFPESDRILIGMLTDTVESSPLKIACAYVAFYENADFFYFTPNDIDYERRLIAGLFYQNNEWIPQLVRYPDVIYDRLRLRGFDVAARVYDEFAGTPFTNERPGNSMSKLEAYDKLLATGQFDHVIIPYERATSLDVIIDYLERYKMIILKPEIGSFGKQVFFITETDDNQFFIAERGNNQKMSHENLMKFLFNVVGNGHFIVQKYIMTRTRESKPFDIRVHLMKNGLDEWSIVILYPRIGIHFAVISSTGDGGYLGGWPGFIKRNFPECNFAEIDEEIRSLCLNIAKTFESLCDERVNEIALDIAIDRNLNLYLIELNANMPGMIYYEFDVARHAIPYATFLAKSKT